MPKISEIDPTPNPNAYRFTTKERLTWGMPRSFASGEMAQNDELAAKLFAISGVINVYYVDTWITITQDGSRDWPELLKELAVPIRAMKVAAAPEEMPSQGEEVKVIADDEELLLAFKNVLDDRIRPALMADGGDLQIVSLLGNTLTVRYYGACGTCPSSLSGTLNAIRSLINEINPEVTVEVI